MAKYSQNFQWCQVEKNMAKIFQWCQMEKIWSKNFIGAKWQNKAKNLFFYFLQFRVYRDLLLFHMIYDFILDTSGTKGP